MEKPELVSVHGGHSGEFCNHALDSLEDVVRAYIDKGFSWVGITEHVPPPTDALCYPDEKEAGLDAVSLYRGFERYMERCRALKEKYASRIRIFVGAETETYSGYRDFLPELTRRFKPEYLVGSVHHVNDICIDYSEAMYRQAEEALGGLDALYERYFDQQFEMINFLKPAVVGHFDLVRIFDLEYKARLLKPAVKARVTRNLSRIAELGLIMDLNVRSLYKGAEEPYITASILREAKELGIAVVPGDDSHGVSTVGLNMDRGIQVLVEAGFDTRWKKPA